MIRYTILTILLTYVSISAIKNWYRSLCFLILMMAVIEHQDWPKTMFGIQGLNPWNIVLLFVLMGWLANKKKEGLQWDLPKKHTLLLVVYVCVIVISYTRMVGDFSEMTYYTSLLGADPPTSMGLFSEHIVNAFKWLVPPFLLYHGCNSRKRFLWGLLSFLAIYVLLALQVIKAMPINAIASGRDLEQLALKILSVNVGFHRVNLSMMLSGAFWALFTLRELLPHKSLIKYLMILCLIVFYGQALTGGRTGYITWAAVGAVMSLLHWKKYLVIGPVIVLIILVSVPAVQERLLQGISGNSYDDTNELAYTRESDEDVNLYSVTSGRIIAWPLVIEKIKQAPVVGYGKMAMQRTGISTYLYEEFRESFPHPHNMYLQILMDTGLLGSIPIFIFYLLLIKYSLSLFVDRRSKYYVVAGGVAFSMISSLLIAGFGSQTFYPREGTVGTWCAIALMLRVYVERAKIAVSEKNMQSTDGPERQLWT
jgi:O-antigen ligase